MIAMGTGRIHSHPLSRRLAHAAYPRWGILILVFVWSVLRILITWFIVAKVTKRLDVVWPRFWVGFRGVPTVEEYMRRQWGHHKGAPHRCKLHDS